MYIQNSRIVFVGLYSAFNAITSELLQGNFLLFLYSLMFPVSPSQKSHTYTHPANDGVVDDGCIRSHLSFYWRVPIILELAESLQIQNALCTFAVFSWKFSFFYKNWVRDTADLIMIYFFSFLFFFSISVNSNNVQSLLNAANQYQVEPVKKMCVDFLKDQVDATNCLGKDSCRKQILLHRIN